MIKILLAEDDAVMREYLTRALEKSGYSVSAVDCGTAALPLLEQDTFDLLLTDIVMPEMDGIELAQKASEMVPDLRVMFITGFAAVTLKAGSAMPFDADHVERAAYVIDGDIEIAGDRFGGGLHPDHGHGVEFVEREHRARADRLGR